ncbi:MULTISPECIES: hypothetical protein [Rhizobium]|uniref:Uncharacterized protein n=1 Tax=Rhizobium chutanense TaxID=2035448 RepID=A0A432P3L4_9HYPH|nr:MULTISPECIES: hypothetical protein [Rhizobium]ARM12100.1 hypothetical protein Bra5_CH01863 [Rhizobium phaseoli Brasil 5]ARO22916.1 hypothetical protein TAL182_CH01103 [Rhizobium sp. TAL182]RUM06786.1 hypothetical protein EFR84_11345 [Rhizobium chutanense]
MDAFLYRVKAAQRDLIERCGGIMRVVEKSGYSKSEVGRWNNGSEPDLMPVGAIAVLERDCGQALVTAVLAETNGRRLTDPDEARKAEISVLTSHAELMRHSAEVANAIAVAISDGQVTPSEATTIDRLAGGLERAASDMRAALAVIKAAGGVKAGLKVVSGE